MILDGCPLLNQLLDLSEGVIFGVCTVWKKGIWLFEVSFEPSYDVLEPLDAVLRLACA